MRELLLRSIGACLLWSILLSTHVEAASNITGEKLNIDAKQAAVLENYFKQYELYSIPTTTLAEEMAALPLGEQTDIRFELGEHEVWANAGIPP